MVEAWNVALTGVAGDGRVLGMTINNPIRPLVECGGSNIRITHLAHQGKVKEALELLLERTRTIVQEVLDGETIVAPELEGIIRWYNSVPGPVGQMMLRMDAIFWLVEVCHPEIEVPAYDMSMDPCSPHFDLRSWV